MQIDTLAPALKSLERLKQALIPEADTKYVDARGEEVKVDAKKDRFNLVIDNKGRVAPLLWSEKDKDYKFVKRETAVKEDFGDVNAAKKIFQARQGLKGNIVWNSPESKVLSNDVVLKDSARSQIGEGCENTIVNKSPDVYLRECHDGLVNESEDFFGWFSHWLRVDKSENAEVTNSDHVTLLKSPRAKIISSDNVDVDSSKELIMSLSSRSNVYHSEASMLHDTNASNVHRSPNTFSMRNHKIMINNSANNRLVDSALAEMTNSPSEELEYLGEEIKGNIAEYQHTSKPETFIEIDCDEYSDGLSDVVVEGLTKVLGEHANISRSPELKARNSKNLQITDGLGNTVTQSDDVEIDSADQAVIDESNGAKVKYSSRTAMGKSPGASAEDSYGSTIMNSPNTKLINSSYYRVSDQDGETIENQNKENRILTKQREADLETIFSIRDLEQSKVQT